MKLMDIYNQTKLNEGFMSYTVNGSDTAADALGFMCEGMVKQLQKVLKEDNGAFNTSGPENVAMILIEYIVPTKFSTSGYFKEIATKTIAALQKDLKDGDGGVKNYSKWITKLQSIR